MRVLVAGLGSIGQRHARNLRTLLGDEVELLAYRARGERTLYDLDLRVVPDGDVERDLGIRAFTDLDDALAEGPDVVFVTNPNSLHLPVALAAARAGRNLFVDKPLADRLDGVDELEGLVEERDLVCLVGYQLRFHPGFRRLQELVASGTLGRPVAARLAIGELLPGPHRYDDPRAFHDFRREFGGGVLMSQIHELDCAYALFGLPERVFAAGGARSGLGLDVEDTASVLLDYGGLPVHVQLDYLRRPPARVHEIVGDEGTAVWDYFAGTLTVNGEVTRFDGFERNDMFLAELEHFLACVEGREQPLVGVTDGIASLRIALAARRSLETGEVTSP
jgi:predicted dehydrogenase